MTLPISLSGYTLALSTQFGPFLVNGHYYIVAGDSNNDPAVLKAASDDPTSSFSEQDASNAPAVAGSNGASSYGVAINGTTIAIFTQALTGTNIEFHTYDTTTDAWGTKNQAVYTPSNSTASEVQAFWTGSEYVILHGNPDDTVMGTGYGRVGLSYGTSGSWTTGIGLSGIGKVAEVELRSRGILADTTNKRVHAAWINQTSGLRYSTFLSSHTFGHQNTLIDGSATALGAQYNMISLLWGSTRKIRVAYTRSSTVYSAGWDDADAPTASVIGSFSTDTGYLAAYGDTQHFFHTGFAMVGVDHRYTGAQNDSWSDETWINPGTTGIAKGINWITYNGNDYFGVGYTVSNVWYMDLYQLTGGGGAVPLHRPFHTNQLRRF